MHHEWRTASQYPEHGLEKYEDLQQFKWQDLWPNVGACMSVRKKDYIRFGGLDEHQSYRGYLCGPYELGWRMINAGIPEVWHDESIALWHFAHPDPTASYSRKFSLKRWAEIRHIHVNHHAFSAVEAFSSGRVMPRVENETIFRLRMDSRKIGSAFEKKYATMCGKNGFSIYQKARLFVHLLIEPFVHFLETSDFDMVLFLEKKLNRKHFIFLRNTWRRIIN